MRRYYAPFILRDSVKAVIVAAFSGLFVLSVISMQHITLGLGKSWVSARLFTTPHGD